MKPIEELKNKIIQGDCMEVMREMPDNSIDTVITDPPYFLGFMGKKWDTPDKKQQGMYEFNFNWAKEALRVAKPGATLLCFGGTRTWHRLACAIEDAGWIIKDTIMWIYGCLSGDSEILTSNGWKKYNEIKVGDEIFSLSLRTKNIEKNKVKKVFVYEVENEPMRLLENQNTSQLLTLNHKVLLREYKRIQKNYIRKGKYDIDYKYIDAYALPIRFKIPLSGIYDGKYSIGNDFAELIGWIISEGNYHKDANAISIYQSSINYDKVKRIRYILRRLKIKYSHYQRERKYKDKKYIEHQFYLSGDIVNKIKEIIPDKKLNWKLLELPYKEKEKLLIGLLEGDGSKGISGKYQAFYQNNLEGLEIFQALLHLTNKQGWINPKKYSCSIHYNNETEFQGKHKKKFINYTGIVWCVETGLGNFIARRNGKIFITGNSGFPKATDISKQIDKMKKAKREKTGEDQKFGRCDSGIYQMNIDNPPKMKFDRYDKPATPEAKQWEGYGTALKPAYEPILLCIKPNEGSYAENALKWGVAGLNIDGGRIGIDKVKAHHAPKGTFAGGEERKSDTNYYNNQGRFPANLILDEESAKELDKQSGISRSRANIKSDNRKNNGKSMFLDGIHNPENSYNDTGGASRFFYVAKASRAERNMGCENMEEKIDCDRNPKLNSANVPMNRSNNPKQNIHPTVKPLKLMEYLCILTRTPTGGIILDPFAGSGTTCMAAKKIGRDFIGIEREADYCAIARARIKVVKPNLERRKNFIF